MSDFVILTDSASDIDDVQAAEWGTPVLTMNYIVNDKLFKNNPDHSEYPIHDFYANVKNGAKVSTSALNIGDFLDFFTPYLKDGKDVLYVAFSSGLSATYQNSVSAANELMAEYPDRRIVIVDSLCASFGQGLLVYLCAEKKKSGASLDEVAEYAESIKLCICHEFTVDDLGQLKRGGRISAAAAFFGSMLQIKPMLFVDSNGKLAAYNKVRSRRNALRKLADMTLGEIDTSVNAPIFISHGDCVDDVSDVIAMLKEKLPDAKFVTNYIGPVIGSHSGFKTLAIFCIGQNRGDARLGE